MPHEAYACDICALPTAHWFEVHGFQYYECRACDYAFLPPPVRERQTTETLFDEAYFSGGGAGYADYAAESALLRKHGRDYGKILRRRCGPLRLLDVGCAAGFVLSGLLDAGHRGAGLEPSASMARTARQDLGLDVETGTLEEYISPNPFECLTMIQLVDHLLDVRRALERAANATASEGYWLFEFGNRASVTARLLREGWHEYAPPSVLRVFSLHGLTRLCAQYGFSLQAHGRPRKVLLAGHAKSLLRFKAADSRAAGLLSRLVSLLPDGVSIPYPGDDTCWALFRRS